MKNGCIWEAEQGGQMIHCFNSKRNFRICDFHSKHGATFIIKKCMTGWFPGNTRIKFLSRHFFRFTGSICEELLVKNSYFCNLIF